MIAVAVSGGVDSLASLLAFKMAGVNIIAVHGIFHDVACVPAGLRDICSKLAVPFHVLDLRKEFQKCVINYFTESLANGLTPNPCAICNRDIKFGSLLNSTSEIGASHLATGHYARLEQMPDNSLALRAGVDQGKDQSYFLALTPRSALKHVLYPLGGMKKQQARELVAKAGFSPPVSRESQDICFLEKAGRENLLENMAGTSAGPIYLYENNSLPLREIGKHKGLWRYTIGQRRGLNIPWTEPLHVRQIDHANNSLILAPRKFVNMAGVIVAGINIFANQSTWAETVYVKLRYNQKAVAASWIFQGDSLEIKLRQPMPATAPGQIAAMYDYSGTLLCGGIIETVEYEYI